MPIHVDNSGGSLEVTDGTITVTNATEIDFVSGASVSSPSPGIARITVTAGGISQAALDPIYSLGNLTPNTWTEFDAGLYWPNTDEANFTFGDGTIIVNNHLYLEVTINAVWPSWGSAGHYGKTLLYSNGAGVGAEDQGAAFFNTTTVANYCNTFYYEALAGEVLGVAAYSDVATAPEYLTLIVRKIQPGV